MKDHLTFSFNANRSDSYYYIRFFYLEEVRQEALNNSNIELLAYQLNELPENQLRIYSNSRKISIHDAAKHGALNVIRFLHEIIGVPLNKYIMRIASQEGQFKVVKYLCRHNTPLGFQEIKPTIEGRHLEMVKYFIERHFSFSCYILLQACQEGDTEIVKYLFERGIITGGYIMAIASKEGHLAVIRYLYENDGPNSTSMLSLAKENGHQEIVDYLENKL